MDGEIVDIELITIIIIIIRCCMEAEIVNIQLITIITLLLYVVWKERYVVDRELITIIIRCCMKGKTIINGRLSYII